MAKALIKRKSNQTRPIVKIGKEDALNLSAHIPQEQLLNEVAEHDPFLWVYKNVSDERGEKLDFSIRPYLVDIVKDFSQKIVYKKSAQVGITLCGGIAKCLFAVNTLNLTSIYTFPTDKEVRDFSNVRFRGILRASNYLENRVGDVDNVSTITFGDHAAIYFKGAQKESQAISVPSQLNIHDELDFSEASVVGAYQSRLDAARFNYRGEIQEGGWEWQFSTPTLPMYGVSKLYDRSDQHQWWIRCEGCRRLQRVNFFRNMRKPRKGDRFFGCLKCDKKLDRTKGYWVPKNPEARIRGYHITQPMCAYVGAERLWDVYLECKANGELRKFYNYNLGESYEDSSEGITRELVFSRIVEGTVRNGPIYIGIDQGDVLNVEVTKYIDGVRRIIDVGTLNSFDDVERLVEHYQPRACVIDAQPNHQNVTELASKHHNIYAAYYTGTNKLERSYWEKDLEEKKVKIPRLDLLDKTANEWIQGSVVIEDVIPVKHIESFADQMTNAKRSIQENNQGDKVAKWVAVGADHYRHADAYNWLACEIGSHKYSDEIVVAPPMQETYILESLFTHDEVW